MPASSTAVAVRDLSFRFDAAIEPLFSGLTAQFPPGFTGVVGANGAGKSTLLELLTGRRSPDAGQCAVPERALYCAQRTDRAPARLPGFLDADDGAAWALRGRLGLEALRTVPWAALSHGERKRLQIGAALWQAPDLLALDEPTNHIDAEARACLLDALARYRGVGVLVSHDRAFLDALCTQCLWLAPPAPRLLPGGYDAGRAVLEAERSAAVHERAQLRAAHDRLAREQTRRREVAARSARRLSKRGIAAKDHDAKGRIDAARVSGKGTGAGRRLDQLSGRRAQLDAQLAAARVPRAQRLGVRLEGAPSRRAAVLGCEAGTLSLGAERRLHRPALCVGPDDRIALVGPNGAGKSTLLRHLLEQATLASDQVLYVAQDPCAADAAACLEALRALPPDELGRTLQLVSRLGSRPEALLSSRQPSPGEMRKLLFARGILQAPQLIVLDEPTNHLDLPSIEALQAALLDCRCALLLVSHDLPFLAALTERSWHLRRREDGDTVVELSASPPARS
jgi:ATPase subunit of ABC transporter with duplicated ATPase domains